MRIVPSRPDYAVTKDGRVFRVTPYRFGRAAPFEMKQRRDSDGYMLVGPAMKVHRLVAEAYVPNPNELPEVCHKDGVRTHNDADNLKWGDRQENIDDMVRHETVSRGEKHVHAKLTEERVREARFRAIGGERHGDIADEFGVDRSVMSRAIRGATWRHV